MLTLNCCVADACTNATATWSIISGGGSINSTGLFTAPGVGDTTVVQVADSIGNSTTATVTTVSTLTISPSTLKIPVYSTVDYSTISVQEKSRREVVER